MLKTNLRGEVDFLVRNGVFTAAEAARANRAAFKASFVKG